MSLERDILRTAGLLVETYGEMAPTGAIIRADQLSEKGDIEGSLSWQRIAKVATDLLSDDRPDHISLH